MKYFQKFNIKTKKKLNTYFSDYQIILFYFGDFELDEYYISPRGELFPSFVFDYYNDEIKWRDFGMSPQSRDSVELVIFLEYLQNNKNKLSYSEALNKIFDDMTLNRIEYFSAPVNFIKKSKKKSLNLKFSENFKTNEIKYWNQYNISLNTLKYFNTYPCQLKVNNVIKIRSSNYYPAFVYLFDKEKEIWKINNPYKDLAWYANNITGHVQGIEQLKKSTEKFSNNLIVITKSYKEVMLFYELRIPAIALHSESCNISPELIYFLKNNFKNIWLVYDNDKTGINSSYRLTQKHDFINDFKVISRNTQLIKDPTDFVKKYGIRNFRKILIDELSKKISTNYLCMNI